MQWIDVFGLPGVGKSTACDSLWPPNSIPWQRIMDKDFPEEWRPFQRCCEDLLNKVEVYRNFRGMVYRTFLKMVAVNAKDDDRVYIHTGFAQRGLSFGGRLLALRANDDLGSVRRFYELMPVSLGVVLLSAPTDLIMERNQERGRQGGGGQELHGASDGALN